MCPVDRCKYTSETFVCTIVYGIAFYRALNLMSCNVMCLKLSCGSKNRKLYVQLSILHGAKDM